MVDCNYAIWNTCECGECFACEVCQCDCKDCECDQFECTDCDCKPAMMFVGDEADGNRDSDAHIPQEGLAKRGHYVEEPEGQHIRNALNRRRAIASHVGFVADGARDNPDAHSVG